jgi:hypothetical protein
MSPTLFRLLCFYGLFPPVTIAYSLLAASWCGDVEEIGL